MDLLSCLRQLRCCVRHDDGRTNMTDKHAADVLADQLTEDHAWAAEELKTYIGSMVGAAEMLRTIPALEAERDALQAKLDRLMLEYCPEEMTPEQLANWAKHQRPVL